MRLPSHLYLEGIDILLILTNANCFPSVCKQLRATASSERPFTVIWHAEPLPPPKSAGVPQPLLNLREIGTILLKDRRATDVYTNYHRLRALKEEEIPDLPIVSAPGRREFLAERGLLPTVVPLGYQPAEDGRDLGPERNIQALFPRAPSILRRKRSLHTWPSTENHRAASRGSVNGQACRHAVDRTFARRPACHLVNPEIKEESG